LLRFPSRAAAEPGRATIGRSSGIREFDSILDPTRRPPDHLEPGHAGRSACVQTLTGQVTPMREPLAPIPVPRHLDPTHRGWVPAELLVSVPASEKGRAEPARPDRHDASHEKR
jgi:hypothetical protein